MAICGRGISCCTGKGLEAGMRKDRGGMEECYNFEGNGGVVLEIDSGIKIPKPNNEVECSVAF